MGLSGSCSMVLFPVFISNSEIVLKIFYKKYIQFCTPWKGTQRGNIINIYTRTLINQLADGQRGYLSNKIYILTSPKIEEIFTFKSSLNAHLLFVMGLLRKLHTISSVLAPGPDSDRELAQTRWPVHQWKTDGWGEYTRSEAGQPGTLKDSRCDTVIGMVKKFREGNPDRYLIV